MDGPHAGAPVVRGRGTGDRPSGLMPAAAVAVAATVALGLPVFLTSALWVQIRDDLEAGASALGTLVAAHFLAAGLLTPALGRVADRLGPEVTVRAATAAASLLLLLVALMADSVPRLAALMVLGGAAQGLGHPATSLLISRLVSTHEQGLAFGIKQAGTPAATLLGGAAVPLIGLTVGWRWAFVGAAVAAAGASACVPRSRTERQGSTRLEPAPRAEQAAPRRVRSRPAPFKPLVLLSVAAAVAGTAAGSLLAFYVSGGVDAGLSEAGAGWALSAGSAGAIVTRVWQGRLADRRGRRHLPVVAAMMGFGVIGHALLAAGQPVLHVVAVPFAFAAGWAWPGLYSYAVVRIHPLTPGGATGVAQAGAFIGGVIGPLVFGTVAESAGYSWAWGFSAAASGTGAVLLLLARRWYASINMASTGSTTPSGDEVH